MVTSLNLKPLFQIEYSVLKIMKAIPILTMYLVKTVLIGTTLSGFKNNEPESITKTGTAQRTILS